LNTQPAEDDDGDVDFAVPFDDDSEAPDVAMADNTPQTTPLLDNSMSHLSGGAVPLNTSAISGLDDDASETSKRPASPPKPRRRKRRKVVIDNENTELSNEDIKNMLADTDDIVRRQIHPAEDYGRDDGDEEEEQETKDSGTPVLTEPFLAKGLHPALQHLWTDRFYQALDRPCPFEREDEAPNDAEGVRQEQEDSFDDDSRSVMSGTAGPEMAEDGGAQQEEPEDDGFGVNMDDDDEEEEVAVHPLEQEESEDEDVDDQPEGTILNILLFMFLTRYSARENLKSMFPFSISRPRTFPIGHGQ
jgi:hypothetical protein